MELKLPALCPDEVISLRLRTLFEGRGYQMCRIGSLEDYGLLAHNRGLLENGDIITVTGADGRLMALKPDATLSIVKNTPPGTVRRVYYAEKVFRRGARGGDCREISQMGLEFIGGSGEETEREALRLAAESLGIIGVSTLDLSHMALVEAALAAFPSGSCREAAQGALRAKSPHLMRAAAERAGLDPARTEKLASLAGLSGPLGPTLVKARELVGDLPGAARPLAELEDLYKGMGAGDGLSAQLMLDFSIFNGAAYYDGLIFQGFVAGAPGAVLCGGRYDSLLRQLERPGGSAAGFAVYLDDIGGVASETGAPQEACNGMLSIALPKGRMGGGIRKIFDKAGLNCEGLEGDTRRLIFEDKDRNIRYFLVKPGDVDIYVERGVADVGICGRDVLLESGADVLELLDMKKGVCWFAESGPRGFRENPAAPLRVATKYPMFARRYYAERGRAAELIKLQGSIELAPLLGLSDVILDIVETGETLRENDMEVLNKIEPSSARLIANRAAWRFKGEQICHLAERLGEAID